eukprot:1095420-Pyramimonas_sp.AAC.1
MVGGRAGGWRDFGLGRARVGGRGCARTARAAQAPGAYQGQVRAHHREPNRRGLLQQGQGQSGLPEEHHVQRSRHDGHLHRREGDRIGPQLQAHRGWHGVGCEEQRVRAIHVQAEVAAETPRRPDEGAQAVGGGGVWRTIMVQPRVTGHVCAPRGHRGLATVQAAAQDGVRRQEVLLPLGAPGRGHPAHLREGQGLASWHGD